MTKRAADALQAKELVSSDYEAVDLNRLVVWTLGWLRGADLPSTFENITVAAYKMFPTKFALRGYPHPDANRVNRALLQLGPKYRNWARGSTGTGYALTPLGEEILAELTSQGLAASAHTSNRARTSTRGYTWDPSRDLIELRSSSAFARFAANGPGALRVDDVWDSLNAYSYTPREALRKRLAALRRAASDAHDKEVARFTDALRGKLDDDPSNRRRGGHDG